MGWTTDTAKELAELLEAAGLSYRTLAAKMGHTYNYWWKRLGSQETALTLEDIEKLCSFLNIDPRALLERTRKR